MKVTQSPVKLIAPLATGDGRTYRYGNGFPFQAGPNTAGVFLNLRFEGFPAGDFEAGMDVVLFDDLESISSKDAVKITRSVYSDHPVTGKPRVTIKHSQRGGFVPFGAKRADGSPHPAAGTGFLLGEALNFPSYGDGYYMKEDKTKDMIRHMELSHLAYDGLNFSVREQERLHAENEPLRVPGSEWKIFSGGLKNAIPDGDDLFFAVEATQHDANLCWPAEPAVGVSRWQCRDGRWRPVSFVPVVHSHPSEDSPTVYGQTMDAFPIEPSLVRDRDGSLLFTERWCYSPKEEHMIRVHRSEDEGRTWTEIMAVPDVKAQAPITINTAADGAPYIVTLKPGHERDWVLLWMLNEDRSGLNEPITVRNGLEDFGPPPSGMIWFIDHPNGTVARLADGKWHGLLSYRVLDRGEHGGGNPTPFTGHYVEEVSSTGAAVPAWNFD